MKILIFALIALAAYVSCTPLTDDEALAEIGIFLNELEIIKNDFGKKFQPIFTSNVDKICVLNKLKKFNNVDEILRTWKNEEDQEFYKTMLVLFSAQCFKNFEAILDFVFENRLTYNLLYQAFIDDPMFKEYADKIPCFNDYAVRQKFVDPEAYSYNINIVDADRCSEDLHLIKAGFNQIFELKHDVRKRECFIQEKDTIERFLLHHGLLIQFELNGEQIVNERKKFIDDINILIDELTECALTPGNEI